MKETEINFEDIKTFMYTMHNVTSMNSNWLLISDMLKTIKNGLTCFDVNRFVAVDTETELLDRASKMFADGKFLAGKFRLKTFPSFFKKINCNLRYRF
jgi:hypothetical protein